jgi:phage-related minor tail protein
MAGTINIRLKVDGVEKSITNIRDLETAISQAKEELKNLNIGSSEFKTLSENIKSAEGQLKNLNKQCSNPFLFGFLNIESLIIFCMLY